MRRFRATFVFSSPAKSRFFVDRLRTQNELIRQQQVAYAAWGRSTIPADAKFDGRLDDPWPENGSSVTYVSRLLATVALVFTVVTEIQNYVYLERLVMLGTPLRPDRSGDGPATKSVPIESNPTRASKKHPAEEP